MRNHVAHLSSSQMDWQQLAPGVYVKMLNHNKASNERTGLFRFIPDEGAAPPSACHYHSISEEIFVLDGKMTFDNETWMDKYAYVYHPPFLVHGFNSSVPETTTFLARSDSDLDFNFPEYTGEQKPFYIQGKPPKRGLAYLRATPKSNWSQLKNLAGDVIGLKNSLSEDPDTLEGTSLIRYNNGVNMPARPQGHKTGNEGFILEGRMEAEDGTIYCAGDYWHRPPGTAEQALHCHENTLIFSSRTLK